MRKNNKPTSKKLNLNTLTVRYLDAGDLRAVAGASKPDMCGGITDGNCTGGSHTHI